MKENLYKRLQQWFYRKLSVLQLKRRYLRLNEVNKIMEEYITKRIMGGGTVEFLTSSRKELVTKQNEIRETEKMIEFLNILK